PLRVHHAGSLDRGDLALHALRRLIAREPLPGAATGGCARHARAHRAAPDRGLDRGDRIAPTLSASRRSLPCDAREARAAAHARPGGGGTASCRRLGARGANSCATPFVRARAFGLPTPTSSWPTSHHPAAAPSGQLPAAAR